MKIYQYLLCALALTFALPAFSQTKLEGVTLEDHLHIQGQHLNLNGAGVRTKLFFDLYVGSLYLESKETSSSKIAAADAPMLIQLDIVSSMITSDNMEDAVVEGFEKATNKNTAPIQKEIDLLIATFKDKINVGDNFQFLYIPGKGTQIIKNGKTYQTISSLQFKKALYNIWLGTSPADKGLKKDMLGM